jgi:hypothetical protein
MGEQKKRNEYGYKRRQVEYKNIRVVKPVKIQTVSRVEREQPIKRNINSHAVSKLTIVPTNKVPKSRISNSIDNSKFAQFPLPKKPKKFLGIY